MRTGAFLPATPYSRSGSARPGTGFPKARWCMSWATSTICRTITMNYGRMAPASAESTASKGQGAKVEKRLNRVRHPAS